MAVTVSIPTILRTHTGGEKAVEAKGATVAEVIDDLESRNAGIADRLIKDGKLHRFINIYVDDEDIRFAGGLQAPVGENSTVTILPAVAGGATILPAVAGGATILPAVAGGATILPAVAGGATILPAVAGGATILPAVAGGATILPAVAGGATILPSVAGG